MINLVDWNEIDSLMMAGELVQAGQILEHCPDGPEKCYRELLLLRAKEDSTSFESRLAEALVLYPQMARFRSLNALQFHEAGLLNEALDCYSEALALDHCQPSVWSNYGLALAALNQHRQAMTAFETAISIDPNREMAWYNKGVLLKKRREYKAALLAFQRLSEISCNPDEALEHICDLYFLLGRFNEGSEMIQIRAERCDNMEERRRLFQSLSVIQAAVAREHKAGRWSETDRKRKEGIVAQEIIEILKGFRGGPEDDPSQAHLLNGVYGRSPPMPPNGYVEQLFDHYAERYEGHLSKVLQYQVPILVHQMAKSNGIEANAILDLGCGTGLCGPLLTGRSLVGVDCSNEMLKVAASKECYSSLVHQDLLVFLSEVQERFDLMVAADVMVYFGALESFFELVSDTLHHGGHIIMSTECGQSNGYRLSYTGRYQHSHDYVLEAAQEAGLSLLAVQTAPLRREEGEWINGQIWLFFKAG